MILLETQKVSITFYKLRREKRKRMKKAIVFLLLVYVCAGVFAQEAKYDIETVYVSAKGSKYNSGYKEAEPTTFSMAINQVSLGEGVK